MARIEKSIEVNVPVRTAYDQWTQFEEFPRFMEGVKSVTQMGERRLHWCAEVGGREKEWDAEIKEQVPDQKIIWAASDGTDNAGIVTFASAPEGRSSVTLNMSYDPDGMLETIGDKLGFMSRRVQGDLERFRDFVEQRGVATGAYRETLQNPNVPGGHTAGRPH
jgi:uncharacterized membrane protein